MHTRVLILAAVASAVAAAQTSRGTVTGTVLDASGATIAGAHVTLTGVETGVRLSTKSNDAGVYRFDAVDLGVYELKVTHPGFQMYAGSGIGVEANRVTTVDPRLEVGAAETKIEVSGESSEILIKDSPLRGGNFHPREVRDLPLVSLNPLSWRGHCRAPRKLQAAASFRPLPAQGSPSTGSARAGITTCWTGPITTRSGSRERSRPSQLRTPSRKFRFRPAISASSPGARAGVCSMWLPNPARTICTVLCSGVTSPNGLTPLPILTGLWVFPSPFFSNNIYGFTAGGPVRKNRTFFFAGFQQNNRHSTANFPMQVPTADAVVRLRSLFPSNPRLDLYLGALGDFRGSGAPFNVQLGIDPQTGIDRGPAQFATAAYVLPAINDGPQWLARVDHYQSEKHRLSWRYSYDSQLNNLPSIGPNTVPFPGFVQENRSSHHNFLFADSYTFGPSYTTNFVFLMAGLM